MLILGLDIQFKNSIILRKRLPDVASRGAQPIESIRIASNARNSRGAIPKLLYGFQELYSTKELLNSILTILEKEIISDKNDTGRPGMSLWEILVLGVFRVNMQLSYGNLVDLVNNHRALRGILGLGGLDNEFSEQALHDNVSLLSEAMLVKVNTLLVSSGNKLLKKAIYVIKN